MDLKEIKSGAIVDAEELQYNFVALKNGISENSKINDRIDEEILPSLSNLNNKIDKNLEDVTSLIGDNKDTTDDNDKLFKSNFGKINERPYVIKYSDKTIMPSWNRIWSNGFIEMGGIASGIGIGKSTTVVLPYELATNEADEVLCTCIVSGKGGGGSDDPLWVTSITSTTITIKHASAGNSDSTNTVYPHWEVKGWLKEMIEKEEDIILPTEPPKEDEEGEDK